MDPQNQLNPLTWKHAHLLAWVVVCLAGGVFATLLGYIRSPFGQAVGGQAPQEVMFLAWLHYPMAYWPWFVFGAIVAGLAFYAADLLTGAR
jgi:hypothetical protein